jgi:hypothetical protein
MIKKKRKYYFKGGVGKLLFFKRHSNLFFVLLDSNKQHIITLTAGSCKAGNTKKQKLSPLNMDVIIKKLKAYMLAYKLRSLHFYMRQKLLYYYRKLFKILKFYKIFLSNYTFILKKTHGIKRGRNPRRI